MRSRLSELIVFTLAAAASAQTSPPAPAALTRDEAVRLALQSNPSVEVAALRCCGRRVC